LISLGLYDKIILLADKFSYKYNVTLRERERERERERGAIDYVLFNFCLYNVSTQTYFTP